ncbi:hypothetical protein CCR75_007061 [Bremia lactucae]|uniref:PX domain-containing protein n=1 Tax=Bremia lactucae TaxID=4779 RepID=A0A976FPA3_BRELC|nr:hypothetical protein CCR75_007061 [Bremia lactucae]
MGCAQSKTEDNVIDASSPEIEVVPAETKPVVAEDSVAEVEQPTTEKIDLPTEPEAETAEEPTTEQFKIKGHEIDEAGVVFYIVEGKSSSKKRFSDFKALVKALNNPKTLPALPFSGLGSKLRGKHNPDLIQEREMQLIIVLNAIANDAELANKEAFQKFVQC